MKTKKIILALATLCLGVILCTGVTSAASLSERRDQIADRQVDLMRSAAIEEEKAPQRLAAMLPVTGKRDFAIILSISAACGLVALGVKKFRKNA